MTEPPTNRLRVLGRLLLGSLPAAVVGLGSIGLLVVGVFSAAGTWLIVVVAVSMVGVFLASAAEAFARRATVRQPPQLAFKQGVLVFAVPLAVTVLAGAATGLLYPEDLATVVALVAFSALLGGLWCAVLALVRRDDGPSGTDS